MPGMSITLDGDGMWPDLHDKPAGSVKWDPHIGDIKVGRLRGGMVSGRNSVAIRLDMPDGTTLIAQTSEALFLMAADALRARKQYEDVQALAASANKGVH